MTRALVTWMDRRLLEHDLRNAIARGELSLVYQPQKDIASGRVIDFLLAYVKTYRWPVFNLADSAIVVGATLLVLEIIFARPKPLGDP